MKRIVVFLLLAFFIFSANAQSRGTGLYAIAGDAETALLPIKYKNIKISGAFKKTARLEYAGAQSKNRFKNTAKFRFVFGPISATNAATNYMFSQSYSINDFGVARFEVKGGKRYLTSLKIRPFGTSSTMVEEVEDVEIKTTDLGNGVCLMEISAAPGEYCIMFTSLGTGGYSGVFDFGID